MPGMLPGSPAAFGNLPSCHLVSTRADTLLQSDSPCAPPASEAPLPGASVSPRTAAFFNPWVLQDRSIWLLAVTIGVCWAFG
jgi:hypothetical protein